MGLLMPSLRRSPTSSLWPGDPASLVGCSSHRCARSSRLPGLLGGCASRRGVVPATPSGDVALRAPLGTLRVPLSRLRRAWAVLLESSIPVRSVRLSPISDWLRRSAGGPCQFLPDVRSRRASRFVVTRRCVSCVVFVRPGWNG